MPYVDWMIMNWRKIEGFENYSVSDCGHVRNDATGRRKKPMLNKRNGYYYVDLWEDNVSRKRPVHRLVAEAFLDNPDSKPTVDHIDGDRTNNHVSNLRWATFSEQNSRFETRGVRSEPVLALHYVEIRKERGGGHVAWSYSDKAYVFGSIKEAAEHFGVTSGNISLMMQKGTIGVRGKMRGYQFSYLKGSRATHKNV